MIINSIVIGGEEQIDAVRKDATAIDVSSNGRASTARLEALIQVGTSPAPAIPAAQDEVVIWGNQHADPSGVIANPSFEDGLTGWVQSGAVGLVGQAVAINGGQALAFAGVSQSVAVVPGQAVTLTAKIRNETNAQVGLVISWLDANRDYMDQSVLLCNTSSTYDTKTLTASAIEGAMFAEVFPLVVYAASTTGTAYVDDVQCTIGNVALFRGYVSRVEPKVVNTDGNHKVLRYALSCQDNTRILDSIYVESASYTNTADNAIIAAIFTGSGISVTGVQNVATLDSIEFKALSLRQCLDRICDRTGAEWRLGFDDDLKYYAIGANDAPFGFAEDADDAGTTHPLLSDFGYQEEFSTPANIVNVLGYQAPQGPDVTLDITPSSANDDASVYFINSVFPPGGGTGFVDPGDPNWLYHKSIGGPTYTFGQVLMRFNTAAIPDDATVVSASLILWMRRDADTVDTDSMRIGGDYYSWSTAATSDYIDTPDMTPDAVEFFPTKQITPGVFSRQVIPLIGVSNISKTGFTGFRLYIDKGSGLPPATVDNTVRIHSRDGSPSERWPTLRITYRPPLAARITGGHTNAASVTLYGAFEKTIVDDSVKTTGEANARAEVETDRYGYPTQSINVSYYRDGINVGDSVPFDSPTLGIDDTYIVKRLQMRWPAAQNDTRYTLELGQFRPDLVQFLRKGKTT